MMEPRLVTTLRTNNMTGRLRVIVAAGLLFPISALSSGCGGDSTGPFGDLTPGTFVATISGDISASFEGLATYSIGEFQDGSGDHLHEVVLVTLTDDPSGLLGGLRLCRPDSELPSGTYTLAGAWEWDPWGEFGFDLLFALPDGREGEIDTWSGNISINSSGDGRVSGSIQGNGSGFVETSTTDIPVSVNLVATFESHPLGTWEVPPGLSCPIPW